MKALSYVAYTVLITMLVLWALRAGLANDQTGALLRYTHAIVVFMLAPLLMRWFGSGKGLVVPLLALVGGATGLVFQVIGLAHMCWTSVR